MLKLRRTPVPPELTTAVKLAAEADGVGKESILSAIQLPDGRWLAGGRSALYLPSAPAADSDGASPLYDVRRIGWEKIERAEWDSEQSILHVWETTAFGTPLAGTHLPVEDLGKFGQLLRERVSASIVIQRHYPITGKKGLRVVGRRNPADTTAEVSWNFVLDKGIEPTRPGLIDAAEGALKGLRDELGL
ncbi:hypothetical protein [Kribbella deserti]|uniref:Uncharacterized protein n=1 Tax=Kribbella deserti TaxID=1926257 RepID=A0ABV6QDR5_9ACTN